MSFFNIQTVPFYVASTFMDFQVERNILRDEIIFPLNKKYGDELVNVKSIDLRWGILPSDSEAEHEEKVLDVCTQQIKRTNSNVILFLGDRYGWVPDKKKMAPYVKGLNLPPIEKISITALEIIYALHYRREDSKTFIYIRNIVNKDELDETTRKLFDEDDLDLKILKEYLSNNYPDFVFVYDVKWDQSKNQIVKPNGLKSRLYTDIESTLSEFQAPKKEHKVVEYHLQKKLHHYVERKYLETDVLRMLRDTSRRGVLINNLNYDGTSTMIAAAVRKLIKNEKSVFYYSEDMKFNRVANVKELLQDPYRIRKTRDFHRVEEYFLDYMYILNLHRPNGTKLFLNLNHDYNRVVVLLREAIKEYIQSKKHNHFICIDGDTTALHFLTSIKNVQFLTSKEMNISQHIVYTKPFRKKEATTLFGNLANDSSKEISGTWMEPLLSKVSRPKKIVLNDASVASEFIKNGMVLPDERPAFEEPEWIKQAFHLLEEQSSYEEIENYAKALSGNLDDLRKNLINLITLNLGESYTKFAISYIGLFNSKTTVGFIQALLNITLPKEATELKFAELQNLLKDYCDFDERGVSFHNEKSSKLVFEYMRKNVMHSKCLPYMISFYESQSHIHFSEKDWLYFEQQLAKLLIEEISINLSPENQLEYVELYKHILVKHTGITNMNISLYEEIIASLKGAWKDSDYQKMRDYLSIPYHMQKDFKPYFIDWCNRFKDDGDLMLQAFQAYQFISSTITTDSKHRPLYNLENEKLMKEFDFLKRILAYRYQVHRFID